MVTENENNFETVVIDGQLWAVTSTAERDTLETETVLEPQVPVTQDDEVLEDPAESSDSAPENADVAPVDDSQDESAVPEPVQPAATDETADSDQADQAPEPEFDPLQALTSLLVGGAIEGTSQLTERLRIYQEAIRQENAPGESETAVIDEDELVRLRYALVGLIFDAQATLRRNVTLWAKLADRSARAANQVTQPVTNSFLFGPARRRYNNLVKRGESSLARWIADGRIDEPPSRELANRTYNELVNEFIDQLAANPQLQAVITQQSMGVASDMRDEVRERTVTADNLLEGLVRRILHRTPRAELPGPPPEIQRWAGLTMEEYRAQQEADETRNESS